MMMTDYKIMNFSDQPVTQLSPTNEDYNGETRSIKSQLPTKSKKSVDQVTLDKYQSVDDPLKILLDETENDKDSKDRRWFDTKKIEDKHSEKFEVESKIEQIFQEKPKDRIQKKLDNLKGRTDRVMDKIKETQKSLVPKVKELSKKTTREVKDFDKNIDESLIEVGLKSTDKIRHNM